ncbi:unnamed protein product [Ixodes hexagonus]
MTSSSRLWTSRLVPKHAVIGFLALLWTQRSQTRATSFEDFYEEFPPYPVSTNVSVPSSQSTSSGNHKLDDTTATSVSTRTIPASICGRVLCKAIRNYASMGQTLLFTCGVSCMELGSVRWNIHPSGCCSFDETYRNTRTRRGSQNADIQIRVMPLTAVAGYVHAIVYDSNDTAVLEETIPFVVTELVDPNACWGNGHCNLNRSRCQLADASGGSVCVCTTDAYPHYDEVHGVCYRAKRLGQHCEYSHECYSGQNFSACVKGVCACNRYTHQDSADNATSCLQAAHLGERCDIGGRICVGAGVRCYKRRCACLANLTRDIMKGCVPVEVAPKAVRYVPQLLGAMAPALLGTLLVLSVTGVVIWASRVVAWCKDLKESSSSRSGSIVASFVRLYPPKSVQADTMVGLRQTDFSKKQVAKKALESAL